MAYLYVDHNIFDPSWQVSRPPYRFFSPLIDALFDDGPNQGKSIKLMKILKPIANLLCQGLNDFAKYEFDPSMTNWSV